jgi:hypothetical protein
MPDRLEVVLKPLLETNYGFDGLIDVRGNFVTNQTNIINSTYQKTKN